MTILAGYDLVLELRREALLRALQAKVRIQDQFLIPPFELNAPFSINEIAGNLQLLINGLDLHLLAGTDRIALVMTFSNSNISTEKSPLVDEGSVALLSGVLRIETPLHLRDRRTEGQAATTKRVTVALDVSATHIEFDASSRERITAEIDGLMTWDDFQRRGDENATAFVWSFGAIEVGDGFSVLEGVDGSIGPLRFERLDTLRCVTEEVVVLFGNLLLENHNNGDSARKTYIAVGRDAQKNRDYEICLAISASAFRALQFCPDVFMDISHREDMPDRAFVTQHMPGCCGSAESIRTDDDVDVVELCDTFEVGWIRIDGRFRKSGFCYEASGGFQGQVGMRVVTEAPPGQPPVRQLRTTVTYSPPTVDAHVDWYCKAAAALLGGTLWSPVIGATLAAVADSIATVVARIFADPPPGNERTGIPGGLPREVSLGDAQIDPEGFLMQCIWDISRPYLGDEKKPSVRLIEGPMDNTLWDIPKIGRFHYSSVYCGDGDFSYSAVRQNQRHSFTAVTRLLARPVQFEFWLEVYEGFWGRESSPQLISSVQLTGASGSVVLPVNTHYPLPMPDGIEVTRHNATIEFTRTNASSVTFSNDPADGNYRCSLRVRAQDATGQVVEDWAGMIFEGVAVEPDHAYKQHIFACQLRAAKDAARTLPTEAFDLPILGPFPDPRVVVEAMRSALASNHPLKKEMVGTLQASLGSKYRSFLSDPSLLLRTPSINLTRYTRETFTENQ